MGCGQSEGRNFEQSLQVSLLKRTLYRSTYHTGIREDLQPVYFPSTSNPSRWVRRVGRRTGGYRYKFVPVRKVRTRVDSPKACRRPAEAGEARRFRLLPSFHSISNTMAPLTSPGPTLSPRPRNPSMSGATSRTRAYLETSGAPAGGSAHDLPSSSALADLELVPSSSRASFPESREYDYRGGGGLGRSASRASGIGGGKVLGKEGKIEEDLEEEAREGGVVDEEAGVGEGGEVILETEAHAQRMYARFSERRKACIVAVVAYAAFIARESLSLSWSQGLGTDGTERRAR